ncbi:GldG family protein [candidate division KSB1 bacterium]|nr:GldG family protein [candidate division KSB1 bacterium]
MKDFKKQFLTTFVIGAVLLAVIIILVNMIFDNINFGRFDFTSGQVYSISPATRKILATLEAPISLTYYVSSSEKMPTQWKNLERDVIDILKELELVSKGKLEYTVFDPSVEEEKEAVAFERDETAPKEAKKSLAAEQKETTRKKIAEKLYEKGVIPFGVQSTDRDEFAVKRVYSSIVLSYLDRKEDVISEVRPETFGSLEYEIMSRIYKLISNKRPKIAFYPSQPETPAYMRQQYMRQEMPDFYELPVKLLKESGYDVVRTNIKADDPIPADITTLVLLVDQALNDRQRYEIEKAVHRGVNVIFAAQFYNFNIAPSPRGDEFQVYAQNSRLGTNAMTRNWGFEIDPKVFMDKNAGFISVPVYQTRNMGPFQMREQRLEPVSKPVVIRIPETNINSEVSISNKINELFYLYGSKLNLINEVLDSAQVSKKTVLFTSSEKSWTRDAFGYGPVNTDEPAEEDMLHYEPLALYVEGQFASTYIGKEKPRWPSEVTPGETPTPPSDDQTKDEFAEVKASKIIAFGCANLFKSQVLENVVSHRALLLNAVDALSLGEDLINIRSKNISVSRIRPTTMTEKFWAKVFVIWFMPLVFIGVGIFLVVTRVPKIKEKINSLKKRE